MQSRMQLKEDTAQKVVISCCILQNFLIEHQPKPYLRVVSGEHLVADPQKVKQWAKFPTLNKLKYNNGNHDVFDGKNVRLYLTEYYKHVDMLPWQEEYDTLQIALYTNLLKLCGSLCHL